MFTSIIELEIFLQPESEIDKPSWFNTHMDAFNLLKKI